MWRYNAAEYQWEFVMYDRVIAFVTDEFMYRVADPVLIAVQLFNRIGSVPPPLVKLLPNCDEPLVFYMELACRALHRTRSLLFRLAGPRSIVGSTRSSSDFKCRTRPAFTARRICRIARS